MRKVFRVAMIVLFLSLIVCYILTYSGCSQNNAKTQNDTYGKPKVTDVHWFNTQPDLDPNEHDRYIAQQVLGPKKDVKKKYKISASGWVDKKKYLAKHPDDALTISSSNSLGISNVCVYTDINAPDPEFFE